MGCLLLSAKQAVYPASKNIWNVSKRLGLIPSPSGWLAVDEISTNQIGLGVF